MKKPRKRRRSRRYLASPEHQSDRRTAQFVADRLADIQEQLCDLLPDMRTFEHYHEMEYTAWCAQILDRFRKKYRKFVEIGVWEE